MDTLSHPALSALSAALQRTADLLRVPVEDVSVLGVEARDWPDSCLGLGGQDEACTDVITPGYLIRLGDGFTFRADQQGGVREAGRSEPYADTEIRLRYTVEGGFVGGRTSFETDSEQLSDADEAELRRLVTEADFFDLKNVLPSSPVADGITSRLWIAVGRRNHEVVRGDGIDVDDTEAFHALVAWAAERTPPLFPRGLRDRG